MSDTTLAYKTTLDASGFASGAQNLNSHLHQMGINTIAASANLGGLGILLGTLANPLTLVALGITAIGGALVGSAQAAAAWETSMTGVAKTTGLTDEALAGLSSGLLEMSTRMPMAADQLASVAAAAGSLGIGQNFADMGDFEGQANAIEGFTEVAIKMGVGFEMSAEQAATAGAKILNSFGVSMDSTNMEKLGSVVNTMGDSFAATEPQVLEFMNRASFLSTTMGQSIPQVAALGTTLISTGLEAEVAATGIKSMLNMLTSTTSKAGGMDNWAKLMGVSVDELKGKVATDLNSTLIETANKIAAIEDPVERFQAAVAAAGSEGAPALLKLAGQQDNYTKALGMTNAEWEKASSLQKTFDAQAGTVNSQWQMFTNTLSMAATQLGTGMLPYLADAIGFMSDLVKVGMKVAEVVGSWNLGEKISDVVSNIPGVSALSEGVGSMWGDVKDWAGIGTEHAEQMAKEIAESDKLQKAGAEGLQAGIDAGVLKDPAKKAATEFSKEFVEQFKLEQADREIAKILGQSATLSKKETDEAVRSFDYLGEQFVLKIRSHTGSSVGDWFGYSLKAGDTVLADVANKSGFIDPLEAFKMATGMPAPAEGTEAYYKLMGDSIAAEKAKLQEQLKNPFDYSDIGSDLLTRMENEGDVIGKLGSQTAKDAYTVLLDNFREPAIEKLGEVLDEIATLSAERPIAASEYHLFGEDYKEQLFASISDMGPYLKDLMGQLGEDSTSAFSDHFFSDTEKESLLGMKPWLEYLKVKSPEEFAKAGGDSWLAFIAAIEKGTSSTELEKMFGGLGQKAGTSFADALGMNMTNALDKFDWASLMQKMTPTTGDGGTDFMKNAFQPELIENATKNLELWNTGLVENRDQVEQNVKSYIKMAEVNPWLFTADQLASLNALNTGLIDEGDALEHIIKATESVNKETKQFTEETDEACEACVNLLSLFDAWQESTPELFHPSYVGVSYGEEFEAAMVAKAASNRLMQLNNERYAQSSKGIVTAHTDEIQSLEQIMQAYHEGTMTSEEFALANKYLGANVDVTAIQFSELQSAIEGVNLAFDSTPREIDQTIQFKTDETQADITPMLGLNTDAALDEFAAFVSVVEGTEIKANLTTGTGTKDTIATPQQNMVQVNSLINPLNLIRTAVGLTTTAVKQTDMDLKSMSVLDRAAMTATGATITGSIASASGQIISAISEAASRIVDAMSGGSGGGEASGVSGTSGSGSSMGAYTSMNQYGGYYFAEGGYVDQPTIAMIGEGGEGEYIVPESKMFNLIQNLSGSVNVSVGFDISDASRELESALAGLSIPAIQVPLAITIDASEIQAAVQQALAIALDNLRLS